ncbi:MAG: DUF2341 domain-containing protein [archaeon]
MATPHSSPENLSADTLTFEIPQLSERTFLISIAGPGYRPTTLSRDPIMSGSPVSWHQLVEFRNKSHEIIYETASIHVDADLIQTSDVWSMHTRLWTDYERTYEDVVVNITIPFPNNIVVVPHHDYVVLGEQVLLVRVGDLDQEISFSIFGDMPEKENGTNTTVEPAGAFATVEGLGTLSLSSDKGMVTEFSIDDDLNINFIIDGLANGSEANVTLGLPIALPEGFHLYLWKQLGNETIEVPYTVSAHRRALTLHLQDGVIDNDGMADGRIVDPLGLFLPRYSVDVQRPSSDTAAIKIDGDDLAMQVDGGDLATVNVVDPDNLPSGPGNDFPYKMLKFSVENLTDGTADITLTYPELPSSPKLWKFNPHTLEWYSFPFETVSSDTIRLTLVDGGLGDDDGIVNGIILDDVGVGSGWWNSSWKNRIDINITNSGTSTLTNFPAYISVSNQDGMQSGYDDLRFINGSCTTGDTIILDHEVENSTASLASVWVRLPELVDDPTQVCLYYNNSAASNAENATGVWREQFEMVLHLSETSGIHNDSTLNDNDATIGGTPVQDAAGYVAGGIGFEDVADEWIKTSSNLDTSGAFTIEFWGNISDAATFQTLFYQGTGAAYRELITIDSGGSYAAEMIMVWTHLGDTSVQTGTLFDYDEWHFYSLVYDETLFSVYKDGAFQSSVALTWSSTPSYWHTGDRDDTDQPVNGPMDEYRFSTINRSVDWIKQSYQMMGNQSGVVNFASPQSVFGDLNTTILSPDQNGQLTRSSSFDFNGTVNCTVGSCSNVSMYVQYFSTTTPLRTNQDDSNSDFADNTSTANMTITSGSVRLAADTTSVTNWWDSSWTRRVDINVTNPLTSTLVDFPVMLKLSKMDGMQNDYEDLRFINGSCDDPSDVQLPFEIDHYNDSSVVAWVRVPEVAPGNTSVCLYYGNSYALSGENTTSVWNSQYEMVLHLEEDSGTHSDSTVNGNDASIGGTPIQDADGVVGGGVEFENVADEWLKGGSALNTTNTFTLSFWSNLEDTANYQTLYYQGSGGAYQELISIDGAGADHIRVWSTGGAGGADTGATYDYGEWHHYSLVYDNTTMVVYKDGQFQSSAAMAFKSTPSYYEIGERSDTSDQPLDGVIDEYRFSQINRTADWINLTYLLMANNPAFVHNSSPQELTIYAAGEYVSATFDPGSSEIDYINISWDSQLPANTSITVYTRTSAGSEGAWWDEDWGFRQDINITAYENLTDFPVRITFNLTTEYQESKLNSDCSDIRFVTFNSGDLSYTQRSYWVEDCDVTGGNSTLWVLMPALNGTSHARVQLYYGNAGASDAGDPDSVFSFFDGFDTGLDTGTWTATGAYTDGPGWTRMTTGAIYTPSSVGASAQNMTIELKGHLDTQSSGYSGIMVSDDQATAGSNSGSDALNYLMTPNGAGTSLQMWGADGTLASYNLIGGTNLYTSVVTGTDYIMGFSFNRTDEIVYHLDTTGYSRLATSHVSGTWDYPYYLWFGYFTGSAAGATAADDMNVTWFRSRKFALQDPTPVISQELNYSAVINDTANFVFSTWFTETNSTAVQSPDNRYLQYRVVLETGNVSTAPSLDEISITYQLSTDGWTDAQSSGTAFTTTNPHLCGFMATDADCNTSFSVIPRNAGNYTIRLKSNSSNELVQQSLSQERNISVYIYPVFSSFSSSTNVVEREGSTTLTAVLLDETSAPLSNYNVTFWDETGNGSRQYIGHAITGGTGSAIIEYTVTNDSIYGLHTLNATYAGSDTDFTKPADKTTTFTVTSTPVIANITADPEKIGFSFHLNITANVTDDVGLDNVRINITNSSGYYWIYDMQPFTGDIYRHNFSDSWHVDVYTYRIIANNSDGISTTSSSKNFYVEVNASVVFSTDKPGYRSNEKVYVSNVPTGGMYPSWKYRKPFTVTPKANISEYQFRINLDSNNFDFSFANETGIDFRVTSYNETSDVETILPYWIEEWDSSGETAIVWTRLNVSAGQNLTLYMYFGNPTAADGGNGSDVFIFYDGFDGTDIDTSVWTTTGAYSVDDGSVRVTTGSVYSDNTLAFSNNTIFEGKIRWYDSSGTTYGGMHVIDVQDMAGSNSGADANVLYMSASGASTSINYWAGDGTVTGYNLGAGALFTRTNNVDYVIGVAFNESNIQLQMDYAEEITIGTYHENAYMYLGCFNGLNCGTTDIQDVNATWVRVRQWYPAGFEPNITMGSTEIRTRGLINTGSTNISGYIRMFIQEYTGSGWDNIVPTVVPGEYVTLQALDSYNLSNLWQTSGAWNTTTRDPGTYRVYGALEDEFNNILVDSNGTQLVGYQNFTILEPKLVVGDLKHENQHAVSLTEYETDDTIDWINITVTPFNNTAYNANVTLRVLDASSDAVTWGPDNETQVCGNLDIGENCTNTWDNSSSGYNVPSDASAGSYAFYWDVRMDAENAPIQENNSISFTLHSIPSTFVTDLTDTRIYKPNSTTYSFSFTNSWSRNLTNVSVAVNCPSYNGFNCSSVQGSDHTWMVGNVENGSTVRANFTITANTSVVSANYLVNVTLNYTNPGGENHTRVQVGAETIEVRLLGILAITDYSHPQNVTRNAAYDIYAYMNNTGDDNATSTSLNYTLPSGWTVSAGSADVSYPVIISNETRWNNITVQVGQSAALGSVDVRLDSAAGDGRNDFIIYSITAYANTTLYLTTNVSLVNRGDDVEVLGLLKFDNGSVLPGQNLSFYDQSTTEMLGSALTNSSGWATVDYMINTTSVLGFHTINVSFGGDVSIYAWPSWNTSTLDIHAKPSVTNISIQPNMTGYGDVIAISARVTDGDDISTAVASVGYPNGSVRDFDMALTPPTASFSFNDTWLLGLFNLTITATDTTSAVTISDTINFTISADMRLGMKTANDSYGQNQYVNLSSAEDRWWSTSWIYAQDLNVTGIRINMTDFQLNLSLDTGTMYTNGKIRSDCGDIRFVQYNESSSTYMVLPHWMEGTCNTSTSGTTMYWIKLSRLESPYTSLEMYYGNPSGTSNVSAGIEVFDFFDDFNGITLDTDAWTATGAYSVDDGRMRVTTGSVYTDNTIGFSNNTAFESKLMWYDASGTTYGGMMVVDVQDMQGSNGGADANILYMSASGVSTSISYYGGDGTVTGYNLGSGTLFTRTEKVDYVVGVAFNDSNIILQRDYGNEQILGPYHENVYMYLGCFTGSGCGVGDVQDVNATWSRSRKFHLPTVDVASSNEKAIGAKVFNNGAYNSTGYLTLIVQRNDSGVWTDISTIINDSASNTSRSINSSGMAIDPIWNPTSWYTGIQSAATYRAYGELTDPLGNILVADDGTNITGSWNFVITEPALLLNITTVRIYEVTTSDPANWHFYTNDFVDSGLNKTFTLNKDGVYRFEVDVKNIGGSDWNVSDTNTTYRGFNDTWLVDEADDVWYSFETLVADRRLDTGKQGGSFNGTVDWNTTEYDGELAASSTATFFFIVNLTSDDESGAIFSVAHTTFVESDYSTLNVIVLDSQPPAIYNNIYNVSSTIIQRGESLQAFARWDETLTEANVSYTTTSPVIWTEVSNSSPQNDNNWTNYTIQSYSTWFLGEHDVNIIAKDENGNVNRSLPDLNFTVWGLAQITSSSLDQSTVNVSDDVVIRCLVTDNTDSDAAITGYNISFFNSSGIIGYNNTNTTGWAAFGFVDNTPSVESVGCNISQDGDSYYQIDSLNISILSLTTLELVPPYYSSLTGPTVAHKGDTIDLKAFWDDNFALSNASLIINTSGAFTNDSTIGLSGVADWSNFSHTIPTSMTPGMVGWYLRANDSSGNINETEPQTIAVWGWSDISFADTAPGSIQEGEYSTMKCVVQDANTSTALSGYNVSFFRKLSAAPTYTFLGYNITNGAGYANFTYNTTVAGSYNVKCNLTHDSAKMYNASAPLEGTDTLNVVSGADADPPYILGDNYTINDSQIYKGECVAISGRWSETLNISYYTYDEVGGSTPTTVNISQPYQQNWTNATLCTNGSWTAGNYSIKLFAKDLAGNLNDSLPEKNFIVRGQAQVYYIQPTGNLDRGVRTVLCRVNDSASGDGIETYPIRFWDQETASSVTAFANASGYANITFDLSSVTVGPDELSCQIWTNDTLAYDADSGLVTEEVYLYGNLTPTIDRPSTNGILHRGTAESLLSTTLDENGAAPLDQSDSAATLTVTWYNNSRDTIASGEDPAWSVPNTYPLGAETLFFNVTSTYYHNRSNLVSFIVYGFANVSFLAPEAGAYKAGVTLNLTCLVQDNATGDNIEDYPVEFYDNSTLLATVLTNSSGLARHQATTDSLGNADHFLNCRIADNATLYYNDSTAANGSVIVTIDTADPTIQFNSNTDANGTYNRNHIFINVTVSDDNVDDVLLWWNGAYEAFGSSSGDTYWSNKTSLSDATYQFYAFVNDTAGNSNQTPYREVIIDTTPPSLTVVDPSNLTWFVSSPLDLNISGDEALDACLYSVDGDSNVSLTSLNTTFYTSTGDIANGTHSITFSCNDTVGSFSTASVTVYVDTAPPSVSLQSPGDNSFNRSSTIPFICDVSDNIGIINVSLYANFSTSWIRYSTNSSGANGTTYTFSVSPSDGTYDWNCMACDNVSCATAATNYSFIVDTVSPAVSILFPGNRSYPFQDLDLNYSASDDNRHSCWYQLDGDPNSTLASCNNGSLSSVAEGHHLVTVYTNDSAGNMGWISANFTVDVSFPTVLILFPSDGSTYNDSNVLDLNYTTGDNLNVSTCWYVLDGSSPSVLAGCQNSSISGLTNDLHNLSVIINDSAGNMNWTNITFRINVTNLVVTYQAPENSSYSALPWVYLNATTNEPAVNCNYSLDGATAVSLTQGSALWWWANSTAIGEGVHNVTYTCNDAVNMTSSEYVYFFVDTLKPNVTIYSPIHMKNYSSSTVGLNYTVADSSSLTCTRSFDQGGYVALSNCVNESLTSLADGQHNVSLRVVDPAGNENMTNITFYVDTTAPNVTIWYPSGTTYTTGDLSLNVSGNEPLMDCWYAFNGAGNNSLVRLNSSWFASAFSLADGTYETFAYCNDSVGLVGFDNITFVVDTTGPVIAFPYPTPNDGSGVDVNYSYINVSLDEAGDQSILEWQNASGTYNISMTQVGTDVFYLNMTQLVDGTYYYRVYVNDSYGNPTQSSVRSVIVSTGAPVINIITPQLNVEYNTSVLELNVTSNKFIEEWWFHLNDENFTLQPNITIAADIGYNSLIVFGRDATGRVGNSSLTFSVNGTMWSDGFGSFTGLETSGNLSTDPNASIAGCWPLWTSAADPQNQPRTCWSYRREINLTSSGSVSDYQVMFNLNLTAEFISGKAKGDCSDLRFSFYNTSDGSEETVPSWVEQCDNSSNITVWVKVPEVSNASSVYLYYGNPYASDASNGSTVFEFFDDFSSISTDVWGSNAANWDSVNGVADPSVGGVTSRINSSYPFTSMYGIELRFKGNASAGQAGYFSFGNAAGTKYLRLLPDPPNGQVSFYNGIDNNYAINASAYQYYSIVADFSSDSYTLYVNHTVQAVQVASAASGSIRNPRFHSYYVSALFVDYLGVRKHDSAINGYDFLATEEEALVNASMQSIVLTPSPFFKWGKLYASATIPSGSNITFQILDALNASLCGNISYGHTSSGYEVCSAARTKPSLSLYAFLSSDAAGKTPSLFHWNITWLDSADLTVRVVNGSREEISSAVLNLTSGGTKIGSGFGSVTIPVSLNTEYRFTSGLPLSVGAVGADIFDVNVTDNISVSIQVVENFTGTMDGRVKARSPLVHVNTTLTFNTTMITLPIGSGVTKIASCPTWDAADGTCSSWDYNDTSDFPYYSNSSSVVFNVSSFGAYLGVYYDNTSPIINAHNSTPNATAPGADIMIFANVTDDWAMDDVWVNINGTNYTMTSYSGDVFNYSFNSTGFSVGIHNYTIYANDTVGNNATPLSGNFTIVLSDADLFIANITFSSYSQIEGENITIFVNVSNNGSASASDFMVRLNISLFNGSYVFNRSSLSEEQTVAGGDSVIVNFSWIAEIGTFGFLAIADDLENITETYETNNILVRNYSTSSWTIFYGSYNYSIIIDNGEGDIFREWNATTPGGNSFYADADASFQPWNLKPLNGTSDFAEADLALGSTFFADSIAGLFDPDGDDAPDKEVSIEIAGVWVDEVPVVNSTNSSSFRTGLLWDSADGGSEYNGSQDLVLVTVLNASKQGLYGVYDYEVRVPVNLKCLVAGTDLVSRVEELK